MADQDTILKKRPGLNILLAVVFVILAAAIIYLLTELSSERKDAAEMKVTLEMQKENLTNELNELNLSFNQLRTENEAMNQRLEQEKQKIQDLLAIKASNAKKIQIYEKEVTSLRSVLKSYIIQVDSLNQANLRLRAENKDVRDRFNEAQEYQP
jgi:signal transduction histidine kinase